MGDTNELVCTEMKRDATEDSSHAVLDESSHAVLDESSHAVLDESSVAVLDESSHAVLDESSHAVLDGSSLQPVGGQSDSKLDDAEVSELSARFVDSLGLPLQHTAPDASATRQLDSEVDSKSDVVDPEVEKAAKKEFNDGMEVISRFAEDVVKTWFARMYKRDLKELFPDGLIGHVATIRMMPSKEMLDERRLTKRASVPKDEESRGDAEVSVDASGWELKLVVVDENHRENLMRWRNEEPGVLQQMQGLLKTAWGYIQYALESYGLPNPELFSEKVIPSPWGTLYVLGAPEGSPQIGVSIVRCEAK